jgi:nucleotide-binding universal stress UspA family protein
MKRDIHVIKKILVATDGSEPSKRALEYAEEVSLKWNAEMVILTVIPAVVIPPYILRHSILVQLEKAFRDTHQSILTEATEKVKDNHPEIKFLTRLEKGHPSDVIVEVGIEEDVDLIVMGSSGRGGVSSLILGSTCRRVTETWTKPLLIIR